jgi:hypothetical protein
LGDAEAEEKFRDAVEEYQAAEQKALERENNPERFKLIIIDLDAAIPGLDGVILGRALLIKASCFYWLYLLKTRSYKSIFEAANAPDPDPMLKEGLPYALEGRELLQKLGSTSDIPWANDIVKKMKPQ